MKRILKTLFLLFFSSLMFFTTACGNSENSLSYSNTTTNSNSEFVVTFDGNGGTLIYGQEKQTVTSSDQIIPPTYTRKNFVFIGWDKELSSITSTCLIKALWEAEKSSDTKLEIEGFEENNEGFFTKVNHDVLTYSFNKKITISETSTWSLYEDVRGKQEIVTKTVDLKTGDNYFYILVTSQTGNSCLYTVNIRRLALFLVIFDTADGTPIANQYVQEESFVDPVIDPIRKGYEFKEWDYDFSQPVREDLTITAKWIANKILITFDVNGGSPLTHSSIEVNYGENVILPQPTYFGYSFKGWYCDNEKINDGKWLIDHNVVLTAKWNGNKHTLTYILNGGVFYLEGGNRVTWKYEDNVQFGDYYEMYIPEKEGYEFMGWYYDDLIITSGVWKIDEDISVEAKRSPKEFNIHYDTNGGDELESNVQKVYYGKEFTLVEPKRDGYEFLGWYSEENKFESGMWTYLEDKFLIAKRNPLTYSVCLSNPSSITHYYLKFDYNDGAGKFLEKEIFTNQIIEIPETPKHQSGYTFRGWFEDFDCNIPFEFDEDITCSKTLYAGWFDSHMMQRIKLNETKPFKSSSNNSYLSNTYFVAEKSQTYTIALNYVYKGSQLLEIPLSFYIYGKSVETTLGYLQGNSITENLYQEIEFYLEAGQILRIEYYNNYITQYLNDPVFEILIKGEKLTSVCKLANKAEGQEVSLTYDQHYDLGVVNCLGYEFVGWYTGENGTGEKLTDALGKSIDVWKYTNVHLVYAYLIPKTYKITYSFDENGYENHSQYVLYDSFVTLLEPNKEGFTFEGWYYGNTKIESGIWKYNYDLNLRAKWKANTYSMTLSCLSTSVYYNVSFDKNDGSGIINTIQVKNGSSISLEPEPIRNKYVFTGWYLDSQCTQFIPNEFYIDNDIILYAGWYFVGNWSNPLTRMILDGTEYKTFYGDNISTTLFTFTAYETCNITLNYTASKNNYYLYYGDINNSSYDNRLILNGTSGTCDLFVTKGTTYILSLLPSNNTSSAQITFSLKNNTNIDYPNMNFIFKDKNDFIINVNFGEHYFLGIPGENEKEFKYWYTIIDDNTLILTDSLGNSLEKYMFTENITVFPFFE